VLASVVWSQDRSSARVLTPHNRSQHIQANTDAVLYSLSPDDGHNNARNMLS